MKHPWLKKVWTPNSQFILKETFDEERHLMFRTVLSFKGVNQSPLLMVVEEEIDMRDGTVIGAVVEYQLN